MMFKPDGKKENNCNDKIKLEGKEIQRVKNARFLGIYIDDKLKFDEQFKRLKDKLKEGLKALICCRKIMNFKAKMLLYNGLIKSHLEYCTISYMDKFNKKQMNEIEKIQKQAIRLIFGARMKTHTSKLFKMAKIIPIKKLYEMETIKFIFKNTNELTRHQQPEAIKEIIFKSQKTRTRLSNDPNKIRIPNEYKKDHCFYNMIDTWNKSKNEYKMAGNLWSLKTMLKNDYANDIELCKMENCETCKIDQKRDYSRYMEG